MIPKDVETFLTGKKGVQSRSDRGVVEGRLQELGVPLDSDFADFYSKFQGPFLSPKRLPELLDVAYPTPEILEQTEYVRTEYGVPEGFVCLTTTEGEGMYLYQVPTGMVFDVGIEELSSLCNDGENVEARWRSFNDFLLDFFGLK